MTKINRRLSKVGLSLCSALLLSGAAGSAARASSIPTSSDEARALPTNVSTRATAATMKGLISTTDEARALAGFRGPDHRKEGDNSDKPFGQHGGKVLGRPA